MKRIIGPVVLSLLVPLILGVQAYGQQGDASLKDSTSPLTQKPYQNVWGMDVLISNDGFGLGTFYRREITPDLSWSLAFSISESKDEREVERYDPYTGISYVPGKLNRFMVLPLMAGLQLRLFREDIMDTFRPYVNAGAGPTMVYMMPFSEVTAVEGGYIQQKQVEFFSSIGRGRAYYAVGAFIGFGANFGSDRSSVLGVNFRYYFTYLTSGDGLPSLFNPATGQITASKTSFGGFFITLNIGMGF